MNESSLANNVTLFPRSRHALAVSPDSNLRGLQMIAELQKTLDLAELFEVFAQFLTNEIAYDGITYRYHEAAINLARGKASRAQLVYRLSLEQQPLGELCISRKRRFSDAEIMLVENRLAALMYPLRNATRYHQAVSCAHRDILTGINNRVSMASSIQRELDMARRYKDAFSMLVIDMDGFKQINDQYGHAAGDQALVHIASILKSNIRTTDLLFRYAGDEFVIGLCKTDSAGAELMANRIRAAVEDAQLVIDGVPLKLRISVGGAVAQTADTVETLFRRADAALYRAKNAGRNQAVFANAD
jgi:diguanylate cyclase (GGDEF)-like protein